MSEIPALSMILDELEAFVRRIIRQETAKPQPYTIGEYNQDIWKIIEDGFIRQTANPSPREILREMRG